MDHTFWNTNKRFCLALASDKNVFPDPRAFKPEWWIETPDTIKY
jgi:hypothetical protein